MDKNYYYFESESLSVVTLQPQILCNYTVHGILQARILKWVTYPFSSRSSQPPESNPGLPQCRQILYQLSHKGSPRILEWVTYPFSSRDSQPPESNPGLLDCRWIFHQLSYQESLLLVCPNPLWGCKKSDTTERLSHFFFNPLTNSINSKNTFFFFFAGIISFSRNIITLFAHKQFSFPGLYSDNVANFLLNHPCIPEANFTYSVLRIWLTTRLIIRNILGIPGGSVVKNIPAMQEMWVWSLGREDPLEKELATHSNILTQRIPWTEKASGLQFVGSGNLYMTQRLNHQPPHQWMKVSFASHPWQHNFT